jgi:hypothetical protein
MPLALQIDRLNQSAVCARAGPTVAGPRIQAIAIKARRKAFIAGSLFAITKQA